MENWKAKWQRIRETYFGSIWDILTWLSLAGIFLWGIAKAFGLIQTPLLVQLLPLFFAIFTAGGFFHYLKGLLPEIRKINTELKAEIKEGRYELNRFKDITQSEIKDLSIKVAKLEALSLRG